VKMIDLVALTGRACANEILHNRTRTWNEEISSNPVQCLLGAFMPGTVRAGHDVWHAGGSRHHEDMATNRNQPIDNHPFARARVRALLHLLSKCHHGRVQGELSVQLVEELERWH
jgi:hypothetical protein